MSYLPRVRQYPNVKDYRERRALGTAWRMAKNTQQAIKLSSGTELTEGDIDIIASHLKRALLIPVFDLPKNHGKRRKNTRDGWPPPDPAVRPTQPPTKPPRSNPSQDG